VPPRYIAFDPTVAGFSKTVSLPKNNVVILRGATYRFPLLPIEDHLLRVLFVPWFSYFSQFFFVPAVLLVPVCLFSSRFLTLISPSLSPLGTLCEPVKASLFGRHLTPSVPVSLHSNLNSKTSRLFLAYHFPSFLRPWTDSDRCVVVFSIDALLSTSTPGPCFPLRYRFNRPPRTSIFFLPASFAMPPVLRWFFGGCCQTNLFWGRFFNVL